MLTPQDGFVLDFASCADCEHSTTWYKPYMPWDDRDALVGGNYWHAEEWLRMREALPSIVLNRQVYEEASAMFYEQPFRFTGDIGWVMLYYFLVKVGPENRRKLKDISVCHPAWSVTPQSSPSRQQSGPGVDDYTFMFRDHMRVFYLGDCLTQPYSELSRRQEWVDIDQFDGTLSLLVEAVGLKKLTLTLPQFQNPEEQFGFEALENHPIHTFEWPQGSSLRRYVTNLVHLRHNCESGNHHMQVCLAEIRGESIKRPESVPRVPWLESCYTPPPQAVSPDRAQRARKFFDEVEEGWSVLEHLYDERGTYPVRPMRLCVNKAMCKLIEEIEVEISWDSGCRGNVDERLEHRDIETLMRYHDKALAWPELLPPWAVEGIESVKAQEVEMKKGSEELLRQLLEEGVERRAKEKQARKERGEEEPERDYWW